MIDFLEYLLKILAKSKLGTVGDLASFFLRWEIWIYIQVKEMGRECGGKRETDCNLRSVCEDVERQTLRYVTI